MNINEKVQYWIEIAEYDLKTTKVMLDGKSFLYVGFMCHQVIEKILKAYYTFKLEEVRHLFTIFRNLLNKVNCIQSYQQNRKILSISWIL